MKWLGCGCPTVDEYGNTITAAFNANDFTICFWLGIAVLVTLLSACNLKLLENRRSKVLYLLLTAAAGVVLALLFYYSMQWN